MDASGRSATLPDGKDWIDEWQQFHVEIWVAAPENAAAGLMSAQLDLKYNTDYYTAANIEYGPAFSQSHSGTIDDPNGTIDNLGASSAQQDFANHQYALLASVRFQPKSDEVGIGFEVGGVYSASVNNGIVMESVEGSVGDRIRIDAIFDDATGTQLRAVPYDLDNNGRVGLGDLALFASVYRETPGISTDSPYAWASDFDRSGTVNLGDLAFFAANYRMERPCSRLVYPDGFSQSSSFAAASFSNASCTLAPLADAESPRSNTTPSAGADINDPNDAREQTMLALNWMAAMENTDTKDETRHLLFAGLGESAELYYVMRYGI